MFAVSGFGPTPSRELLETLANCMITVLQLVVVVTYLILAFSVKAAVRILVVITKRCK